MENTDQINLTPIKKYFEIRPPCIKNVKLISPFIKRVYFLLDKLNKLNWIEECPSKSSWVYKKKNWICEINWERKTISFFNFRKYFKVLKENGISTSF